MLGFGALLACGGSSDGSSSSTTPPEPAGADTVRVIANGAKGGQTADLWDQPSDAN